MVSNKLRLEFNLIATTYRGYEHDATSELAARLEEMNDYGAKIHLTDLPGLILAQTNVDPFKLIDHMYSLIEEEPWRVRYLLRLIPIEKVTRTKIDEISEAASQIALSKIAANESFKVVVEKRKTDLSRLEIIEAVAERIDRRVNLENPDWIVLIEVVGEVTGLSVLKPKYIFSSVKAKRKLVR